MEEKSWFVVAILEIIQGKHGGDVNKVLKELLDWCVDDDEQCGCPSSPHLPREENKLRALADKRGELQIARDTLIHRLDLLVAKVQSTVSSPPGGAHHHQDQDEDQGPGKAPVLTRSSSSLLSSSSSPETEGTVLPPADDRDRGDQNIIVASVDGDDGIGEDSARDTNAQGKAPAITTPPSSSSSSESEVGTSSASVHSQQGVGGQNIAIELIDDGDDQSVQDHAEANVAPEIMIPSSSSSASSSESDVPIVW